MPKPIWQKPKAMRWSQLPAKPRTSAAAAPKCRHHVMSKLPSHSDLPDLPAFKIELDVAAALENEKIRLSALISAGDLSAIFARIPGA